MWLWPPKHAFWKGGEEGCAHHVLTAISQADTSGFTADPETVVDKIENKTNVKIDNKLIDALQGAASSNDLKDFYQVGLWSYCSGTKAADGKETIDFCSSSKVSFWFNPIDVWGLKNTSAQELLGDDLQKGLDAYKRVSGWMVWAFIIAVCLTAAEFIIGFFAIFSRWGSFVVTIISTVSFLPTPPPFSPPPII